MDTKIKIIITDDHVLFIEGLISLLRDVEDFFVCGVANNGRDLLQLITCEEADIILMDINMPDLNGLETIRYLRQRNNNIKIIMLSSYQEEHLIEKAKKLGANGYLPKNVNKDDLLQTIRIVQQGTSCFPFRSPDKKDLQSFDDNFLRQFNLTARENELLQLIKDGCTNQQIANALSLSIYTVETHRKNIMQKLKLKSPSELMKFILLNNI
ncbi:MAG TPA: response regulator transcription factor [Chitinophagaceae bacterium]|nr:response regulator transcription factor [Chitinophagaceae bacterium]